MSHFCQFSILTNLIHFCLVNCGMNGWIWLNGMAMTHQRTLWLCCKKSFWVSDRSRLVCIHESCLGALTLELTPVLDNDLAEPRKACFSHWNSRRRSQRLKDRGGMNAPPSLPSAQTAKDPTSGACAQRRWSWIRPEYCMCDDPGFGLVNLCCNCQ